MCVRQCGVPEERASSGVGGLPWWVRALVSLLRRMFGPWKTMTSRYAEFYSRMQSVGETLVEFSRALIRQHQRIEGAAIHSRGTPGPGSHWRRRSEAPVC